LLWRVCFLRERTSRAITIACARLTISRARTIARHESPLPTACILIGKIKQRSPHGCVDPMIASPHLARPYSQPN
jgi:hypothetical protein